jgi:hypothetical protein
MNSGNSKWVRAILTTAVILAITAMTVPAMASIPGVTFTIPPTSYNISGYVIYITVPPKTSSTGMLYVYLNSSDTGPYFYVTAIPANAMGGATNVPIMLPYNIKAGNYTIYVSGTQVNEFTALPYTKGNVSSPFELKFTISPGFTKKLGQTVTLNVTGWGFTPGETVVIELGNPATGATQTIYTTTANTWGFVNATVSFTAPSSPGEYYIIAVGQSSGVTYIAPFYVTTAYVTPSLMAVYNGYSYTLKGFNFPQGTYVDICINGIVNTTEKLVSTTKYANFNVTIPIQHLPFGNYSIVAISTPSPAPVGALCPGANETYEGGYANATWTVVPQIVLNTTSTCSGFTVNVSGYGFPANTDITIYVNKTLFSTTVTTSPYGTFTTTYMPSEPGTYVFTTNFTYTYVNKSTYPIPATLKVLSPTISISPSEQIVGGLVTINGTCLPPNTLVKVSIGSVDATNLALNSSSTWTKVGPYVTPTGVYYTGYVETNPSGSFSGRYVVPLLPPGTYKVNVSVGSIQWNTSLTIPSPTISFSSTHTNIISAYEGEEIYFVGQNFANFTLGYNMTINLNGYYATCQNNTLVLFGPNDTGALYCEMFSNGIVTGYITMPVVPPGTYTVYFNGTFWSHAYPPGANGTAYSFNDTLSTTANIMMKHSFITVTPSPAPAGSTVTVTGYNFYPDKTVNIYVYLNGTTLVTSIMNVPVGSNGEFTATFTAPNVQSGYLYIVAEESQSQYIAGTVGYATANVTITNVHVVIINLLNEVLSDLKNMNSTLYEVLGNLSSINTKLTNINSTLYGAIQSVGSMVTNVNNALTYYAGQILGNLSNIQNTLGNIQTGIGNLQTALSQDYLSLSAKLGIISSTLSTIQSNTVNILGNLTKMNATLTAVYSAVQSMGSELSAVYNAVLSVNSTVQSMSSTLSSIGSTLSSMQSTLSSMNTTLVKIYGVVSTLNLTVIQDELSTISNNVLSVNSTLATYAGQIMSGLSTVNNNVLSVNKTLTYYAGQIMSGLGTVQSALSGVQSALSTISNNVLSVNSTLATYAGQVLSNLYNIENTLGTMQSTMSSRYSTIQGELGAIESTLVSMNNTLVSKVSTVPSVVGGSGSYTFTSPGTYTIYRGSGVAQITVTLYYTGYTTAYIYVYPIPGDTTHVVKLQVTSSAGYTVTVSGWRVDIYVTSAWPYSPVTVYYSYTAIS